jgi:hypothetical protein
MLFKFEGSFQRVICYWPFLLRVLPDAGISDIVFDDAKFWGAGLCLFVFMAQHLLLGA